jgi:hypothetical protein
MFHPAFIIAENRVKFRNGLHQQKKSAQAGKDQVVGLAADRPLLLRHVGGPPEHPPNALTSVTLASAKRRRGNEQPI